MATEYETILQRIETAKSDIAQAIRDKEVSVPATAKIDEFASYIARIPVGTETTTKCDVTIDFGSVLSGLQTNQEIVISYTRYDGVGNILNTRTNESFEALRGTPIFIYIPVLGTVEFVEPKPIEKMVHNDGCTYIYYASGESTDLGFYLDD